MRTKILLASAVALAFGVASSNAQVYSANVVGYINLTLTNGFNLIANQLDVDGTGTNNTLQTSIGTQLPNLSHAWAFSGGGFQNALYAAGTQKWTGNTNLANAALNPGQGLFIQIPATATTPITVTLVGNVMQGSLSTPITAGFQIVSSQVPLSGAIDTALNYHPSKLDKAYQWNVSSQSFPASSLYTGTAWSGAGDPNLAIGQALFLNASSNNVWSTNFVVQ